MKYVVNFQEGETKRRQEVATAEDLVVLVQKVLVSPKARNRLNRNNRVSAITTLGKEKSAEIKAGALVFNKATCQTRIARSVDAKKGVVVMYNHDDPSEAEKQKTGVVTHVPEYWQIGDCVAVNLHKMEKNREFFFGSPIGRHEDYLAMQIDALGLYT